MNLEDIMLSEISWSLKVTEWNRTEKTNTVGLDIYEVFRIVRIIVMENRIMFVRGWGEGEMGKLLFNEYRLSVLQHEKSYGDGG